MQGLYYYPHIDSNSLPTLLNQGFEYLILDLGSMEDGQQSEFLRCDRKVVLGSLAPWKSEKLEQLFINFNNKEINGEGFFYLVQAGHQKACYSFCRTHHALLCPIPFIKNPFLIEKDLFTFLQNLAE